MNFVPKNDWVVVKMKPLKDKTTPAGIVILKDTAAQTIREGEVLLVGPGRRNAKTGERIRVGVEKGEKVAFLRWNLEHQQGKQISQFLDGLGEDIGLIREADILFAFTGELSEG